MINQNVYIEMNKIISDINSQKSAGYIPDSIRSNGKSYHHSRDSAFVICSMIELVKMGTYKLNKVMNILLGYLYFEKKVYQSITADNLPPDIINSNGKPYLNRSNSKQYDVIALRILSFLQIYDLFKNEGMGEMVENVIFGNGMVEHYVKILINIYNVPCYDIWGKVHGIHYCNVKLYEMALNSCIGYINIFHDKNIGMKIRTSMIDIKNLLLEFDITITINYELVYIIVPTLKDKYNDNTVQYELNSSIFIPYLPIFGYSRQMIDNARLINSSIVIFSNNDDTFINIINSKRIVSYIPYISRYGYIVKKNERCCIISTLATYYMLINMNGDVKDNTILKMWSSASYNSIRTRSFDKLIRMYGKLKIRMGSVIDKSTETIINNDNENLVRSLYSCVINDVEMNNSYVREQRGSSLKEFNGSLLGFNNIINFSLGKPDNEKNEGTDENMHSSGAIANNGNDGEESRKSGIGILFNVGEMSFRRGNINGNKKEIKDIKKDIREIKKYNFKKNVYCDCDSKDENKIIDSDSDLNVKDKEVKDEKMELLKTPDEVTIECLIDIAERYYCFKCNKKKRVKLSEGFNDINVENFVKIRDPLVKLTKLRGLSDVKDVLLDNIIYFMMRGKKKGKELLHVCIMGPPGVGKTVLAGIIAEIYGNLGILSKGHLVKATRTDLIGKYVGHTSAKTRDVIKSAEGGILFIDEVYSLVDREGRDSFSKACVDTLTQYLTSKCEDMLCIIAGYKKDIEDYFFKSNKGLERRFAFKFHIEGYKYDELFEIFCDKMKNNEWDVNVDSDELKNIFQEKYNLFKNFGGDVENLVYRYNLVFNRKNFFNKSKIRKIESDVLKKAIDHLFTEKGKDEPWRTIYT